MRPPRLLTLTLLVFLCLPASAQEGRAWRIQVDRLLDRWSDDVGSSRVERALNVLEEHLKKKRNRRDGEALLEKARLLLARNPPPVKDAHQAATLTAANYNLAATTADLAAECLTDTRRHQALVVACLAFNYQLRAQLGAMELIPGNPKTKKLLARRGAKLEQRRAELNAACGEERATQLIAEETQRVEFLKEIDALGAYPRPIAMEDTDGKHVDLTTYTGKTLLIVFWSGKIGDAATLKEIAALAAEIDEFEVLGVNLDDRREDMDNAVAELGLGFRHCFDGEGISGTAARAWQVRELPGGALVDRTGRVRYLSPWRRDLRLAVQEVLSRRAE